jgi:hypothetical protein
VNWNLLAPLHVGTPHHHAPVETAGEQRRIEHVRAIGSATKITPSLIQIRPFHQLIQGLLALMWPPPSPRRGAGRQRQSRQ